METQDITTTELPAITQEQEIAPTTSVKNFWERLDDVFLQNTELREKMEELVNQFPDFERARQQGFSSVFQPDRIVLNSKDKYVNPTTGLTNTIVDYLYREPNLFYSTFTIKLQKALVNVKSIQLLSAVMPMPQNSIPDSERFFRCYQLRNIINSSTGAWNAVTNYNRFDIVTDTGNYYYLNRDWNLVIGAWSAASAYVEKDIVTVAGNYYYCNYANINVNPTSGTPIPGTSDLIWTAISSPYLASPANNSFFWNIIGAVGAVPAGVDTQPNWLDIKQSNVKRISFLNMYQFLPEGLEPVNTDQIAYNRLFQDYDDLVANLNLAMTSVLTSSFFPTIPLVFYFNPTLGRIQMESVLEDDYFYMPCGYQDSNAYLSGMYQPMNVRLGFTWHGLIPGYGQGTWPVSFNPFSLQMRRYLIPYITPSANGDDSSNYVTFNTFPDLCFTSAVMAYCDFTQGSTQDSEGQGNLLSVIPTNAAQLGIGYYQNNFNNPLTKVPSYITEITIRLLTDKNQAYLLPNESTVLLELAIDYK